MLKLKLFNFLWVEVCVCELAFGHFVEFGKSLEEDGETVSILFGQQVFGFLMSGDFEWVVVDEFESGLVVEILFVDGAEDLGDGGGFGDVLEGEVDGFEDGLVVLFSADSVNRVPGDKGFDKSVECLVFVINDGESKNNGLPDIKKSIILKEESDILQGYFFIEFENKIQGKIVVITVHVQEEIDDLLDVLFRSFLEESLYKDLLNALDFLEIDLE